MLTALAFLLLMPAPAAAGGQESRFEVVAQQMSTADNLEISGDLVALHTPADQRHQDPFGEIALAAEQITIDAAWARYEHSLETPDGEIVQPLNPYPDTEVRQQVLSDAVLSAGYADDRHAFFVMPWQGSASLSVSTTASATLSAGDGRELLAEPISPVPYEPPGAEATGMEFATSWRGTEMTVTGDFMMALWDWNLEWADGATTWSGIEREQGLVAPVEMQHVYLYIEGGMLTIELEQPDALTVVLGDAEATPSGSVVFSKTVGAWDGGQFSAETVRVDRPGIIDVATAGSQVLASFTTHPTAVTLDNAPLSVPVTSTEAGLSALWLLTVPLVLAAAILATRWNQDRRYRRLAAAMDQEDYPAVLQRSQRRAGARHRVDTATMASLAAIRTKRLDLAAHILEDDSRWTKRPIPVRDYLRAHVAAARGDAGRARRLLGRALAAAPELAKEARHDPVIAKLMGISAGGEAYQ